MSAAPTAMVEAKTTAVLNMDSPCVRVKPDATKLSWSPASAGLNGFPPLGTRGLEHRVCDVVGGEAVSERRAHALAFAGRAQEIRKLVDEGVFVPDLQARHPPVLHVRVVAVCDVH